MPTYDYRCTSCKHAFEEFQSMTAKLLKKCPSCGKPALERLIGTGAAVMFKGSGFYQTDYRSEGYKNAASADKPAESAPSSPKPDSAAASDSIHHSSNNTSSTPAAEAGPSPKAKPESKTESKPLSKPAKQPRSK